jgi:flagellin
MSQASKNAEQANSLLQIAEGGVSSISKMVERMKEIATQAASDNVDTDGRNRLQAEFTALQSEITRTVDTTEFQNQKLLNGGFGSAINKDVATSTMLAGGTKVADASSLGAAAGTYTIAVAANSLTMSNGTITQEIDTTGKDGRQSFNFDQFGISITTESDYAAATAVAGDFAGNIVVAGGSGSFLVGSSGDYAGQDTLQINSLDVSLATLGVDGDTLATRDGARTALTNLDAAIGTINTVLGNIGATQNRIEFAQSNLKTSIQNFSAAESVIRDLDMAEEMTKFSKNNILAQAGTAMLAQANQSAQGVLQLLRG